ncbi:hypothetical protein Cni_G01181 [Canna indica]|uniref:Secreted protein n=1 Tax=Canna indica TaxID=4628 RepID=A0AAQ3PXU6_9LILI|nr:hypothetical protein Cni_G01181 [Canna indica]
MALLLNLIHLQISSSHLLLLLFRVRDLVGCFAHKAVRVAENDCLADTKVFIVERPTQNTIACLYRIMLSTDNCKDHVSHEAHLVPEPYRRIPLRQGRERHSVEHLEDALPCPVEEERQPVFKQLLLL